MIYSNVGATRRAVLTIGVVAAGFLVGCGTSEDTADQSSIQDSVPAAQQLAPAEFANFVADNSDAPLVNVHIPYEGHIDGTDEFVPFEDIGRWSGLPTDKLAPIAVYCRSGNMSAQAASELKAMGYANVVDLDGGMNAWAAAGMTVEKDEPAELSDGVDLNS